MPIINGRLFGFGAAVELIWMVLGQLRIQEGDMLSDLTADTLIGATKKIRYWLYQPYKYLVFGPVLGLTTAIEGTLTMVLVHFLKPRTVSKIFAVSWARINSFITPMRVQVYGRENIDPRRSYVIVSNHQSHFDIFVLYGWIGVDFKWVMKSSLIHIPFLGPACDKLEHIFIDRSNHAAALASINEAKKRIVDGTSVLFFPEGTRSSDGRLLPFKKGAFKLALDLGLPVLPVTIDGTRHILPKGTIDLLPGRAVMTIHPPVPIDGYGDDNIGDLMDRVRTIVAGPLTETSG
jgi:1-acyl-sn-glycerol-3-phosphate acyltransferase